MSCYILRNEYIEDLAESICYALENSSNVACMGLDTYDLYYELNYDCKNKGDWFVTRKIAEKLYKLNEMAYCGRYKDEKPSETMPVFKDGHNLLISDVYRLIHILESYLYQCSEQPAYEQPLYKALSDFLNSLYRKEIRKSEAYKKADLYA